MSIQIIPLTKTQLSTWLSQQPAATQAWVAANQFKAKAASCCLVPDAGGAVAKVLLGVVDEQDFWSFGALPKVLPVGDYEFAGDFAAEQLERMVMAWGLGCYQYDKYKKAGPIVASLVGVDAVKAKVQPLMDTFYLVRDLINTPTEEMNTAHLADAVVKVGAEFNAEVSQIIGDDLLAQNYPLIHAVGRAADPASRLIDLRWGDEKNPKITLVCKGVVYDTGGLSLKPTKSMLSMKKDMGGSGIGLGIARMIMQQNLPVRLRLLVAAAENAIGGNSFRPGDVYVARNGKSVEITNTDAEGRLVMADALVEASSEKPDYLFDFSTLTGAARVATGTDIPAFFTQDEAFADGLKKASKDAQELMWQLPLYDGYRYNMDSDIADIKNSADSPFGGATNAALFLKEFVEPGVAWCHFDLMAANSRNLPGRPKGGEAQALRAVLAFIKTHY